MQLGWVPVSRVDGLWMARVQTKSPASKPWSRHAKTSFYLSMSIASSSLSSTPTQSSG